MSQSTKKSPDGLEEWEAKRMDRVRQGVEHVPYILDPETFTYRKWNEKPPVREEDLPPVFESVNPVPTGPFR